MVRRFDIVMVTDARLPGGTSASVAEEVRAQVAAGFRTALLQVDSPLVRRQRPMSPRLRACLERGEMELLLGDEPIETDLVMLRHPTVARSIDPATAPSIRATNRLLVANQAPGNPGGPDATDDQGLRYEPHEVDRHVSEWLDGPVDWVPIGPLVRADLTAVAPELPQLPDDWVNVIDVAAWRQVRQGARHRVPVIGRHSRDDPMKWPATRDEVLRVYPDSHDVEVHVLGGEPRLRALFGERFPANWVVHPFGSMPPERFLAGIDIYVYYHHPALVEAFGRTIMEAMASGAPTVLPPHFRVLFEDAALYAEPDAALTQVRALHRDRAMYREAADRATAFVEERFGHSTHVARVAELAEPTGRRSTAVASGAPRDDATDVLPGSRSRRRVLFVSSNGAGVGHLMRLMALAKRAPDDIEPLFLTFSQGAKVVDDAGHFVEYLASRALSGSTAAIWHPYLRERVNELIDRYDIRAMVFDGTWPYQGFLDAATDQPGVGLVWSRRAMWKAGVSNPILDSERDRFDLVLEPGEFAADDDRGPTRAYRSEAVRLGPVSYLGLDELLDRADARAALDLDPDRPAALVNLGAGNINDVSSDLGMVVDRLAAEPDLQVCVVHSIIADRTANLPDNVRPISIYPLARYLQAFDLAFAASGYNSYHELLLAGVPTAFVPNLQTATDDQAARSRFAHRVGVGIDLPELTIAAVDRAATTLMDPDKRRRMHERAVARRLENGAAAGMQAIVDLIDRGVGDRPGPTSLRLEAALVSATRPEPTPAAESEARSSSTSAAVTATLDEPASDTAVAAAEPESTASVRPGVASAPSAGVGGSPSPAARGSADRVLQTGRRILARLLADGPIRMLLARGFYSLPAPVRLRIRRVARGIQPTRAQVVTPGKTSDNTLPVAAGGVLRDAEALALPSVAIVLPRTADTATLSALIDHVAQLQVASRGFAPLFITSNIDFRPLRRYGFFFEYFPDPDRWHRADTPQRWEDARRQRLTGILRAFGIRNVLLLPEPGDDGLEELRGLVSAGLAGVIDA